MKFRSFDIAILWATNLLLQNGRDVDAGSWQGYETEGHPSLITKEILNLQLEVPLMRSHPMYDFRDPFELEHLRQDLSEEIQPNLPWADAHFDERVGREPTNPGEAYQTWPWWQDQGHESMHDGIFSHTYQERFWPKQAGNPNYGPIARQGVRYQYGDLDDLVSQLRDNPTTRQAYLPIYFPEDTGAKSRRTPCTLGYHFLRRNNKLHMFYHIRSCDLVRHFRDDLYLACRLLLWVLEECHWADVIPGTLHFTAYSFHIHKGDLHHVKS